MRAVGQCVVFGLMLAAAVVLLVIGSLLVVWVGTDWAEGGGLLAVMGIAFVVVGAMLACGSIFLARRRRRYAASTFSIPSNGDSGAAE